MTLNHGGLLPPSTMAVFFKPATALGFGEEGLPPFVMDKKLHDAARAWTSGISGRHPPMCALGYESSSTGLGWFVHEGTWWLGHGRECGASPNGKPVANPCMLPADWQEQRETSQWVTRPHCWYSSGCILGDSAPGPLIRVRCCRWRYSKAYPPVSLFIFLTLILSMASA